MARQQQGQGDGTAPYYDAISVHGWANGTCVCAHSHRWHAHVRHWITRCMPAHARTRTHALHTHTQASGHTDVVSRIAEDKKRSRRSKRSPGTKAVHSAMKANAGVSKFPARVSALISQYADLATQSEPEFVLITNSQPVGDKH